MFWAVLASLEPTDLRATNRKWTESHLVLSDVARILINQFVYVDGLVRIKEWNCSEWRWSDSLTINASKEPPTRRLR